MRCRDVITVVLDNSIPIIIRDKHLRSQLTGRDKTERNPGKPQPEQSMNQVRRPDIPDFSDAGGKKRENHIMMRSQSSDRRWNSREWGDVMMRIQVTAGH